MSDLWSLLRSCHFFNLWAHALSYHAAILRPPPRLLTNHQLMDLDVAVIPKFKPQHQFQMRLRRPSRRPPQRHTLAFEKCWSWVSDTISTMSLLIAS
ncbi:hypothetical protein QR685DRAFT_571537 [Neurospora intermedia]|uniref:Uncharacterized protein n=1 Tax=Neurospora intermedia TaxID=5142 RepID=A0ABR3DCI8_NEUIN